MRHQEEAVLFDYSAWIFYPFRSNQSKPRERNTVMANDKRQQCIDECVACAQECEVCVTQCCAKMGPEMADCLRACLDCASICWQCAADSRSSRQSSLGSARASATPVRTSARSMVRKSASAVLRPAGAAPRCARRWLPSIITTGLWPVFSCPLGLGKTGPCDFAFVLHGQEKPYDEHSDSNER